MQVDFNGNKMAFNLVRGNLRKEVASYFPGVSEEDITDGLVKYDPDTNTVAVDERASDSYAKYAAIHECICCGPYEDLAPATDSPNRRCGLIDKMLIQTMPESERKAYKEKRIEMFKTLIERKLNPPMEPAFLESIETLESL